MPEVDPTAKSHFECPFERYATRRNIKRVAEWWCGGDCERAKALPISEFVEILFCAIAEEKGAVIEAEERALADQRKDTYTGMGGT